MSWGPFRLHLARKRAGRLRGVTTGSDSQGGEGRLPSRVEQEETACLNVGVPGDVVHGSPVCGKAPPNETTSPRSSRGSWPVRLCGSRKGQLRCWCWSRFANPKSAEWGAWNARAVHAWSGARASAVLANEKENLGNNETRSSHAGGSIQKVWPREELREMLSTSLQPQTVRDLREGLGGHPRRYGSDSVLGTELGCDWSYLDEG